MLGGAVTQRMEERRRYRFEQRLGQQQVYIRFYSIEAINDSCGVTTTYR